jgi:hypothetical protein
MELPFVERRACPKERNQPVGTSQRAFALVILAAGAASDLAVSRAAADVQIFNVTSMFDTSQNPSGPWSYNLGGTPISSPISGVLGTGWGYLSSWDGCIISGADISQGAWDIGAGHDWRHGDVIVHAYSFGGDDSIRFVCPADGTVDIAGAAWDAAFFGGRDASWTLSVSGITVAERSSVYGLFRGDAGSQFAENATGPGLTGLGVHQGDVIEFAPHTSSSYGHFVGVDFTIGLTTVPGPASLATLGFGCVAMLRRRRAR